MKTPMTCFAVLASLSTGSALAGDGCVPPPHEDCDGALVFTTADLPYFDSGLIGCENDVTDKPYWDIFYRYDCKVTATHVFEMCDSEGDTYLRIYSDGCGWSDGDELAVADDDCPGSPPNADPRLVLDLVAGASYWIELGTWRPDAPWGEPNLPFVFDVSIEAPACPADVTGNGAVDVDDLLAVLAAWGTGDPAADIVPDGIVNVDDLLVILASWGACP